MRFQAMTFAELDASFRISDRRGCARKAIKLRRGGWGPCSRSYRRRGRGVRGGSRRIWVCGRCRAGGRDGSSGGRSRSISSRGMMPIRSRSILTGSSFLVSSRRREMRWTWVSTTTPSALWNQTPRTTLAVLRAAPGMVMSSFQSVWDTCRRSRSTIFLRRPDDGFRFVAEEAGGLDLRLEFFGREGGEILRSGVAREKRGGDHVHARIGALGGEDGGDQQFPGAVVGEGAGGAG